MIAIREAQVHALMTGLNGALVPELCAHLMEALPSICHAMGGRRALAAFVDNNLERAVRWDLQSPAAIAMLFELFLQFGAELERSPIRAWCTTILEHTAMDGDSKVETIWERHHALTEGRPVERA
jgi:hypothetical protein